MPTPHYHNRLLPAGGDFAFVRMAVRGRTVAGLLSLLLLHAGCSQPEKSNNKLFSDEQFQELSLSLSDKEQYFDTDNLISNERPFQHLIPAIKDKLPAGGAYLGVGPDQNFTYISGTRPSIAFIIDIRRHNLLQHLYFKELFERAPNRVEFLSLLLSRPTQTELSSRGLNAADLVEIFLGLPADRSLTDSTVSAVFSSLRRRFPEMIQEADRPFLDQMAGTFRQEGLRLRFRSHRRRPRFFYPTLGELLTGTDRQGIEHGYLSSESYYSFVRTMQFENRIIPLVGDLGGTESLKAIGGFLEGSEIELSLFYVSNVEFYLASNGKFHLFSSNVGTLPINGSSLLLRTVFRYGTAHPETAPGSNVTPLIQSVEAFLRHNSQARTRSYYDLVMNDYIPVFSEGGVK